MMTGSSKSSKASLKRKENSPSPESDDSGERLKWTAARRESLRELTQYLKTRTLEVMADAKEMEERDQIVKQVLRLIGHLAVQHALIIIQRVRWPQDKNTWCSAATCEGGQFLSGEYRFALQPALLNGADREEYFHIECLECLLDLSRQDILTRVRPHNDAHTDGHNFLDEGALITVLKWIQRAKARNVAINESGETTAKSSSASGKTDNSSTKAAAVGKRTFHKDYLNDALKEWGKKRAEILACRKEGVALHADDHLVEVKMNKSVIYANALADVWNQKP